MNIKISLLVTITFFLSLTAQATPKSCLEKLGYLEKEIPFCPKKGCLVPEIFPVAAVMVSDLAYIQTQDQSNPDYTIKFVTKVLKASGDKTPLIFLPVLDSTFQLVQASLKKTFPKRYAKISKNLIHLKGSKENGPNRIPWQHDFFEIFLNSKSEQVMRYIGVHRLLAKDFKEASFEAFDTLSSQLDECGFQKGEDLNLSNPKGPSTIRLPHSVSTTGMSAGNIEGYPGAITLLGDKGFTYEEWKDYAGQFCDPNKVIKVPTDWLYVGHVDQLVKVIRNKKKKLPAQSCDFSVLISSPKKALELLNQNKKDQFVTLPKDENKICPKNNPNCHPATELDQMCELSKSYQPQKNKTKHTPRKSGPLKHCDNLTNEQFLNYYQMGHLKKYNELAQKEIDFIKMRLSTEFKKSLPSCGEVDFIETPALFYSPELLQNDANQFVRIFKSKNPLKELSQFQMTNQSIELSKFKAQIVLPNLVNGVVISDTSLLAEPYQLNFKAWIQKEIKERGIKTDFIDTFFYGHLGRGNLHCTTKLFHLCKPTSETK